MSVLVGRVMACTLIALSIAVFIWSTTTPVRQAWSQMSAIEASIDQMRSEVLSSGTAQPSRPRPAASTLSHPAGYQEAAASLALQEIIRDAISSDGGQLDTLRAVGAAPFGDAMTLIAVEARFSGDLVALRSALLHLDEQRDPAVLLRRLDVADEDASAQGRRLTVTIEIARILGPQSP